MSEIEESHLRYAEEANKRKERKKKKNSRNQDTEERTHSYVDQETGMRIGDEEEEGEEEQVVESW